MRQGDAYQACKCLFPNKRVIFFLALSFSFFHFLVECQWLLSVESALRVIRFGGWEYSTSAQSCLGREGISIGNRRGGGERDRVRNWWRLYQSMGIEGWEEGVRGSTSIGEEKDWERGKGMRKGLSTRTFIIWAKEKKEMKRGTMRWGSWYPCFRGEKEMENRDKGWGLSSYGI